jgi:uncharacterized protein (TIGR03435 family)
MEFRTVPGRLTARNADLRTLIKNAFGIRLDTDLIGGPRWIGIERFDIVATAPASATEQQMLAMLQSLLAERFQLAVHLETKEAQIYKLRVAIGGPKLQELKVGMKPRPASSPDTRVIGVLGPTSGLVRVLSRLLGRDVIDETGLIGKYDLSIEVAREETLALPASGAPVPEDRAEGAPMEGPSIIDALREQLGLKLVAEKAPISILIVDSVERPQTN